MPEEESSAHAFRTAGGLRGRRWTTALPAKTALDGVWRSIDGQRGALFVSNYEAPDRYARWDIGFVRPPLAFRAWGRRFALEALHAEGRLLLPLLVPFVAALPGVVRTKTSSAAFEGEIDSTRGFFTEEQRGRNPSVFSVLRALLEGLRCEEPALGLYGAFGFDLVWQFEPLQQQRHPRPADAADCVLFLPTDVVLVDHQKERAYRHRYSFQTTEGALTFPADLQEVTEPEDAVKPADPSLEDAIKLVQPASEAPEDTSQHCDHAPGTFAAKVEEVRDGCRRGDFFEVVLSQSFWRPYGGAASALFRRICARNPSPYSFLINMGDDQLVGASPEMYVRVVGRRMETSPISGTVPVGETPMETAAQIRALLVSEKEEAELTMCTDVDRNDMARVCVPGSVRLLGRRLIERYSRLVHTVDHLEGELLPACDAIDAFVTHLWACTTTGAPKPAALQAIERLENSPRRWYGGAVGFLQANGDMNSGMTLRTVHLHQGRAEVRAGATLLYDSDPNAEERETRIKASAFLDALIESKAPASSLSSASPSLALTGATAEDARQAARSSLQRPKVLLVDFWDSFVHTLAAYFRVGGAEVITVRADLLRADLLDTLRPGLVCLSPGPGTPQERGVAPIIAWILQRNLPLFGVCLGHQGLAEAFGARLGVMSIPAHGKAAPIYHGGEGIYEGLPNPFHAARYHSLYVRRESIPAVLEVDAHTSDGMVMGVRHRHLPLVGIQFHPESILTLEDDCGQRLLDQVLRAMAFPRGEDGVGVASGEEP